MRLVRSVARYAQRAILFGALPSRAGARFIGGGRLFISAEENRGRNLRRNIGVSQPLVNHTWRRIIALTQPSLVLDIGANYGEIVFGTRYPDGSDIFVIEANPRLIPFLERSRATHPDAARIGVFNRAASDQNGWVTFTIDEKWSGTSSVIGKVTDPSNRFKGDGPERFHEVQIETTTVSSLLADIPESQLRSLAFKIDVEGYEGRVLKGMADVLQRARCFVGIIEFDVGNLKRAGTGLDVMLELGSVARFGPEGLLVFVEDMEELPPHCDLIFASEQSLISALAPLPRHMRRYATT